jgi:GAF domain-containing protein
MSETTLEAKRLTALRRYEILDTPPDGAFDRLTSLASKMFNMPISIISLVDEDRIWFKSQAGLGDVQQIDRAPGLCASAILSKDVYLVENAIEDPRTLTNPMVSGSFGLRFYAAAPLKTHEGYNLGTFCIIDRKQRYISREQTEMLEDLAAVVVDEMEIRLAARNALASSHDRIKQLENEVKALKNGVS